MQEPIVESCPFVALLSPQATAMMTGTFPPKEERHMMQFHYPNFQNGMWRVYGLVSFGDAAYFQEQGEKALDADKIKAFLSEKGTAPCPTALKVIREYGNASDKFLKVIETVDLAAVLVQMPKCCHLCTTGGKATGILLEIQGSGMKIPKTDETVPFPYTGRELTLTCLLPTSRAYPLSLVKKVATYRAFLEAAGSTVFQEQDDGPL